MNERMAKNSYGGGKRHSFYYYRSTGKRWVHLVEEEEGMLRAYQVFEREEVKKPDLELLKAFQKKNPGSDVHLLAPVSQSWVYEGVRVEPWEWILSQSGALSGKPRV
jgi:hypothetical protein